MRIAGLAFVACCLLQACGDIETTDTAKDSQIKERERHGGRPPVGKGFVFEPYGIGASWFEYEQSTHAVMPQPEVYLVEQDELTALVDVVSYYNDRGDSGFFKLKVRLRGGETWSSPETISLSESAKKRPVCVSISPLEETKCDAERADLVFRINQRVVPSAGFAVANPAILTRGHFSERDTRTRISSVSAESLSKVPDVSQATPLASAQEDIRVSAIGRQLLDKDGQPRQHVYLQATGAMKLVQWQLTSISSEKESIEVEVKRRCVPLAKSPGVQTPIPSRKPESTTITLRTATDYSVALVDLCAGKVKEQATSPYGGLWPSTDTFDVFFEQVDGAFSVRLPPGQLVWDWSAAEGPTEFRDVNVPEGLWEQ